jgi:SAM-dependent methyltransferase
LARASEGLNIKRSDRFASGFLVALTLIAYWRWFGPGTITDQDWWNYTQTGLRSLFPWPGGYNLEPNAGSDWLFALNYFPIETLFGGLGHAGLSTAMAQRIVVMFPTILLLPFGMYALLRRYVPWYGSIAGAVFYASNAYINVIVGRGQMTVAESYAAIPLAVAFGVAAVRRASLGLAVLSALVWSFAFACDVRIALLGLFAFAIFCGIEIEAATQVRRLGGAALIWCATAACLLAYVWYPLRTLNANVSPPHDFADPSWIPRLSSAGLLDLITAYKPLWHDNLLHNGEPWFWLYAIVLTAGLIVLWAMSPRLGVAVAGLFALAAVAASGANTWFGGVYIWLFTHTWFVGLFRDPSKFYAPVMLAFSFAFAACATACVRAFRDQTMLIVSAFIILGFAPMIPELIGLQSQLFVPKLESTEELALLNELARDRVPGRVLWVPVPDRMVPGDYVHPAIDATFFTGVERDGEPVLGDAQTLRAAMHELGIRYVVIRHDGSEGLDWQPSAAALQTVETYALLGALGTPVQRGRLTVYRFDERLGALPNLMARYHFSDEPIMAGQGPRLHAGEPESRAANITLGNASLRLPFGFRPAGRARVEPPQPLLENVGLDYFAGVPAIVVTGKPQFRRIESLLQRGPMSQFEIPDWTAFAIFDLACNSNFVNLSVEQDGGRRRFFRGACVSGRSALIFATQGTKMLGASTSNGRLNGVSVLGSEYAALVDRRAGIDSDYHLTLRLPESALLAHTASPPPVKLTSYAPSPVRIAAPVGGKVVLPFADSPFWQVSGPGSLFEVETAKQLDVSFAPDPVMRRAAAFSLYALLFWSVVAIVLLKERPLGTPSNSPVMAQVEEFYGNRRTDLAHVDARLERSLAIVSELRPSSVLDVACGHGAFLNGATARLPNARLVGCDISHAGVDAVKSLGFEAFIANVEEGLPFKDESFDCVFFGEVIEHLIDPDKALIEVSRVLRKGGTLILTTPNLASWFNRLLLLGGVQPIFTETSLKAVLGRKHWALGQWKPTVGHLKVFTLAAVRDILSANGFAVTRVLGAPFHERTPIRRIDELLATIPSLASNVIVVSTNGRTLESRYPKREFDDKPADRSRS